MTAVPWPTRGYMNIIYGGFVCSYKEGVSLPRGRWDVAEEISGGLFCSSQGLYSWGNQGKLFWSGTHLGIWISLWHWVLWALLEGFGNGMNWSQGVECFPMEHILVCWELMKSVGSHGNFSTAICYEGDLIWHFVSNSHEVVTVLIFTLPWNCSCGDFCSIL